MQYIRGVLRCYCTFEAILNHMGTPFWFSFNTKMSHNSLLMVSAVHWPFIRILCCIGKPRNWVFNYFLSVGTKQSQGVLVIYNDLVTPSSSCSRCVDANSQTQTYFHSCSRLFCPFRSVSALPSVFFCLAPWPICLLSLLFAFQLSISFLLKIIWLLLCPASGRLSAAQD